MAYDEFDPLNRYRAPSSAPLYGRPTPEGLQQKWVEMPQDDSQQQALQGGMSVLEKAMKRKLAGDIGGLTDRYLGRGEPLSTSMPELQNEVPQLPTTPALAMPNQPAPVGGFGLQKPRARRPGLMTFGGFDLD
jgi:hypothetical protein